MWCSHIRVSFRKLIEYNPIFFSKNEYIHITERLYKDGEFRPEKRSFHIYCTACDSLVFICDNTEKCANKHLNECIAKIEERHLHPTNEFKEKIHRFINSAIAIQRIWRAFKLGPETWVQRVWNIVRNDGTPDRKRFLGELPSFQRIIINPETQEEYALRVVRPTTWIENKKHQLLNRLSIVAYIVAFIVVLHQQDYRNVKYGGWSCQLKCLLNSEYYCINQYDHHEVDQMNVPGCLTGKENVKPVFFLKYRAELYETPGLRLRLGNLMKGTTSLRLLVSLTRES
ncbi:hypothetical protein GLOIN_2v1797679 [Rhizophagus irregularis DAOM 181602=DAOM 197198]|nr:hypothetical protein GLOIN_2v1797679 [Rhizophagus irregularis DAOM 181602=DAOM 197198]